TKDNGFIMLHVLFVISLLLLLISHAVASYRMEVHMTDRQIEQIKMETLFQMAREQYKTEYQKSNVLNNNVIYYYPQGEVNITILETENSYVKLSFVIRLPDSDEYLPVNHLFIYD